MYYRKLGRTGIDVSAIALGCWPFAGGGYWGEQDDQASIATVHAALDAGINFFDTAEGYGRGHSERVLGAGLKGRRDQAVIATKVSANHLSAEGVARACEGSLANLQTETIDLYQVHWPNWSIPLSETVEALGKLQQQGKVRAIGVSNFAVQDLGEMLQIAPPAAGGGVQTDQLPYGLLWRAIEDEIQPLCVQAGVGILCYSPLAQGLLAGIYPTVDDVPENLKRTRWYAGTRPNTEHDDPGCEAEVFDALDEIRSIAAEVGAPMAAVALAWLRQQAGVTSILVGARKPDEVGWNLPSLDLTLPDDVLAALSAATEPVKQALGGNPDMWMSTSRMR
jgi:aryl-alcohol dehydrogenase-like predicted oxidoreductase